MLILDNVPTHRSDFTIQVANLLNIYLLPLPEYSPELNPIEGAWDYSKLHLKKKTIDTKEELIDNSIELFLEATSTDSLYKTTVNKFIPQLI